MIADHHYVGQQHCMCVYVHKPAATAPAGVGNALAAGVNKEGINLFCQLQAIAELLLLTHLECGVYAALQAVHCYVLECPMFLV